MTMEHHHRHAVRSILVVDDDLETLDYLRMVLSSEGYGVVTAADVPGAQRELEAHRFQLVLTDLSLPEGSGLDVLDAARRSDPVTVGIVLSGHGTVDSALQAMRQGAYDYLVKPTAPDVLLAAVARGIEHYELKRQLIEKTAQLESLESQLHHKSRLIANVSHELKNPLSVVYGYSSFLLRTPPERPDDLRRSLQSIHNNAERLGHLLEEMLESSRLHARKVELDRGPVAAGELLREAGEYYRFEATKREVDLRVLRGAADAEPVHADAKRVHQILANLISNALKFTPADGSVILSARKVDGFVEFSVRDTGVGIDPEHLPHLFERYYQVDATKKHHQGLGLGLEITKGLVELHGGRIWAESQPGEGTNILFTLPLASAVDSVDNARAEALE